MLFVALVGFDCFEPPLLLQLDVPLSDCLRFYRLAVLNVLAQCWVLSACNKFLNQILCKDYDLVLSKSELGE